MRPLYDLASVFADQIRTAETESSRVYEPVIGIVTDNKDPDKLGRVKLKIPVLSDQDTTFWCPIIMLGAGKIHPPTGDQLASDPGIAVLGTIPAITSGSSPPPRP